MALGETVILALGPSLAKAILRTWLGKDSFGADAGAGIVEILTAKTKNVLLSKPASRRFEDIGERVPEQLIPIFEIESPSLDESSKAAVIHEVAATLDSADLSSVGLVRLNLVVWHT